MGLIRQTINVITACLAWPECVLWREFVTQAEEAYRRDKDHRFIISVLRDESMPPTIRRRIVEMLFQRRILMTPAWDAFDHVVTLSAPPPLLRFMERALHELPQQRRKFLDVTHTQRLYQLL